MSTSTTTTSGFAMGDSQDLDVSNSAGDDSVLNRLNRPDDPSFEVEDSVRCTRCTSAQSLSSVPAVSCCFFSFSFIFLRLFLGILKKGEPSR